MYAKLTRQALRINSEATEEKFSARIRNFPIYFAKGTAVPEYDGVIFQDREKFQYMQLMSKKRKTEA